jgi:hypothetical protein
MKYDRLYNNGVVDVWGKCSADASDVMTPTYWRVRCPRDGNLKATHIELFDGRYCLNLGFHGTTSELLPTNFSTLEEAVMYAYLMEAKR